MIFFCSLVNAELKIRKKRIFFLSLIDLYLNFSSEIEMCWNLFKANILRVSSCPLFLSTAIKYQKPSKNLKEIGGNINDWGKYETESFNSPTGKFKVHYYYNKITKKAYFDADYKSVFNHQGNW